MEYTIITLPASTTSAIKLLNDYAKEGWHIVSTLADYRLILEKETPVDYLVTYISPDEAQAEDFIDILVSKGLKILGACGENRLIFYGEATPETDEIRNSIEMIKKYFEETSD